jgi:hypothetical protein
MGSNQDLPITWQETDNGILSGTVFTECFKTMYTAYFLANGQTRVTPNILCDIRHKAQTLCTSGLIAVVILFNGKSSAYQTKFRGKSELRFVFNCLKFLSNYSVTQNWTWAQMPLSFLGFRTYPVSS